MNQDLSVLRSLVGEPLLNRDLPRMIRYLKACQVYVLFNSNDVLLTRERQAALIESGLDERRVSLDGSTPETCRTMPGIDAFERVVENVAAMIRLKREPGRMDSRIFLWMTDTQENLSELPGLIERAARISVDEVYLQRLVFSGQGLATAEQSILRASTEDAMRIVGEAQVLAARLGVVFRGAGATGQYDGIAAVADRPEPWRGCARPLRLVYVSANGNALPCCRAPFTGVPYERIILGNHMQDGIQAVWADERYRAFRDRLYSAEPTDACRNRGVGWSL